MLFYHKHRPAACKPMACLLVWSVTMPSIPRPWTAVLALPLILLLYSEPAAAFRCGNKLVKKGMHEAEVVAICGEPTAVQHLGYALRSVESRRKSAVPGGWTFSRHYGHPVYSQEVRLTEFVYNLGPRKFMRRLVFADGVLTDIEKLGRGYHESRR